MILVAYVYHVPVSISDVTWDDETCYHSFNLFPTEEQAEAWIKEANSELKTSYPHYDGKFEIIPCEVHS